MLPDNIMPFLMTTNFFMQLECWNTTGKARKYVTIYLADMGKNISILKLQGESIQMNFQGKGFVVIQPYEEVYFQSG